MSSNSLNITQLLQEWNGGDEQAREKAMAIVYEELKSVAHRILFQERSGHIFNTTALVHEAYVRLSKQGELQNREQFFALSAMIMRRILIDYARKIKAQKRGGGKKHELLDEAHNIVEASVLPPNPERLFLDAEQLLILHRALKELHNHYPLEAKVLEMKYFGGMNNEEIATLMNRSIATIDRYHRFGKVWLADHLARS